MRRGVKYIAINTGDWASTLVNYQTSYYKVVIYKITKGVTKTDLWVSISLVKHYIEV